MQKTEKSSDTYFAPGERASVEAIDKAVQKVVNDSVVNTLLTAVDGFVIILNQHRQALSVNEKVAAALGIDIGDCLGRRPGEILECVHASEGPSGCGTSRHCSKCGAVLSILATQQTNQPIEAECRLTRRVAGKSVSAEFRVRTAPINVEGLKVLSFVLQDISELKRKEVLERIFVHDLNNMIGSLKGYVELWEAERTDFRDDDGQEIVRKIVVKLFEELKNYTIMNDAEKERLRVMPESVRFAGLFKEVKDLIQEHSVAAGKELRLENSDLTAAVGTDRALLTRVLVNMVKNALEASEKGDVVTIRHGFRKRRNCIFVHNKREIPKEVALQVFQRYFSTKPGAGRGLGTYSMKLIGENYLKGTVDFTTSREEGTTFFIELPDEIEIG